MKQPLSHECIEVWSLLKGVKCYGYECQIYTIRSVNAVRI